MSVRVFSSGALKPTILHKPEYEDRSFDQDETTVNGQSFHWGPNLNINFLDDGVGLAHAGFKTSDDADQIVEDIIPFNNSRS